MFAPIRVSDHFVTITAEKAWEEIRLEQVPYLTDLYQQIRKASPGSEFQSYRAAAFERCPGMEQLMFAPFYAQYITADGQLVIWFATNEAGEVEVTHQLLPLI